jgi:hypothetical protein
VNDDDQMVIAKLRGEGAYEVSRVRTFKAFRRGNDGKIRELTVEVSDAGPNSDNPELRFNCIVRIGDGESVPDIDSIATGNGGRTLDDALSRVHWHKLNV